MGSNLCCLRHSGSDQKSKGSSSGDQNGTPASQKQLNPQENLTLEQCLMASPGLKRVYPSSPDVQPGFSTPRISFSSDRTGKIDEHTEFFTPRISFSGERVRKNNEDEDSSSSINGGSPIRKSKKKVSFKLPEVADIIIFYSPGESFEE
ncbi:unnamed protein product [Ilex paraguariensis]|uniref:Uncharacterized protein n=1 Tax=Ilex paraguariensis TaxID=185542 RepID=A0ABC8SQD6_9AQUA